MGRPRATGPPQWLELERLERTRPLPGWQHLGHCTGHGPNIFFPGETYHGPVTRSATAAKNICDGCPVRYACLAHHLTTTPAHEDHGVWGGTTVPERRRIRRALTARNAA